MPQKEKSVLAERLHMLRVASGMKQEDIANYLGISRSSYTYYELSRSKPDYDSLIRLASLFRVSVDYLIGKTNFPDASRRVRVEDDTPKKKEVKEMTLGDLTDSERHLLYLFRLLPEDDQLDFLQEIRARHEHASR